jgi:hypothetical protein
MVSGATTFLQHLFSRSAGVILIGATRALRKIKKSFANLKKSRSQSL